MASRFYTQMFQIHTRLTGCYASLHEMNTLTDVATRIAFPREFAALIALHGDDEYETQNFGKWVRSRRVREVPMIFEVVKQAMFECNKVLISSHAWEQFTQWRQHACPQNMRTDTVVSVYFMFVNWNKHNLPRRSARRVITMLAPDSCSAPFLPVQSKNNDVIDQHIRQSAPTVRIPRRLGHCDCVQLAYALEPRKLNKQNVAGLAVVATDVRKGDEAQPVA